MIREAPQPLEAGAAVPVRQLLREGTEFLSRTGAQSARLDAELLLGHVLGWKREALYVNLETWMLSTQRAQFEQTLRRRARGEPVAYITGEREFWSLGFTLSPAVLVPRPETELLVDIALRLTSERPISDFGFRILDLGTGSGAIAVSLAKEIDGAAIWATDISLEALKVAEGNATRHGVREKIRFLQGDLFRAVEEPAASFDIIVSNPPYVRRDEIKDLPPEVRDWEPALALDGGSDGLDFYGRIIEEGHVHLRDGGLILLEIGADMRNDVFELLQKSGWYSQVAIHRDYAGKDRVVVARKAR